jgi:hypothetical protein
MMPRMKNQQKFTISSANRTAGDDPSNCKIQIDIPPHLEFTHVSVWAANIPKSYYLVQAGYNTFGLVELGANIVVVIPPGNYGATTFATALTAALNAVSNWTYTVTFSTLTLKYTYTVVGSGGNQPSFVFGAKQYLYEQLGFEPMSTNVFAANTLVGRNVIRMQSEDTLFMHSDLCTIGVLQELYSTGVADGGIIGYRCLDCHANAKLFSNKSNNVFSFVLTDEFNNPIRLNGQNWVMTLLFFTYEEDKST